MSPERCCLVILLSMLAMLGVPVVLSSAGGTDHLLHYLGFVSGRAGTPQAWAIAGLAAFSYIGACSTIPQVRRHLWRPSLLKAVSLFVAVCAAIVEEVIFRKWLMDFMEDRQYHIGWQVAASGLAFGLAHLIWGVRDVAAGVNAALSTFVLGCLLAVVYLVGGRSLAPCVAAHFVITAAIEPGLVLAVLDRKLGWWRRRA